MDRQLEYINSLLSQSEVRMATTRTKILSTVKHVKWLVYLFGLYISGFIFCYCFDGALRHVWGLHSSTTYRVLNPDKRMVHVNTHIYELRHFLSKSSIFALLFSKAWMQLVVWEGALLLKLVLHVSICSLLVQVFFDIDDLYADFEESHVPYILRFRLWVRSGCDLITRSLRELRLIMDLLYHKSRESITTQYNLPAYGLSPMVIDLLSYLFCFFGIFGLICLATITSLIFVGIFTFGITYLVYSCVTSWETIKAITASIMYSETTFKVVEVAKIVLPLFEIIRIFVTVWLRRD